MNKVVIIGAPNGFSRLAINTLAHSGHAVYASMRETKGRNAIQVASIEAFARERARTFTRSSSTITEALR